MPPIAARRRGRSPTSEVRAEDLVDEEAAGAATMTVGGGRGGRQRLDDVGQARSCAVTRRVGRRAHLHAWRAVTHAHNVVSSQVRQQIAKFHYTDTDTDTGPTRTRTRTDPHGPNGVSPQKSPCPCPCPCLACVRVRVVEFSSYPTTCSGI